MPLAAKIVVYAVALLGLSFLASVTVGKALYYANRRADKLQELHDAIACAIADGVAESLADALADAGEPRLTVVWQENHFMQCSLTGRVEWVDDDRVLIDDGKDHYVMVPRSRIRAMY
jgi:hypothetical protein